MIQKQQKFDLLKPIKTISLQIKLVTLSVEAPKNKNSSSLIINKL